MDHTDEKRTKGQYYTLVNPFQHPAFIEWADKASLYTSCVLEPFAGQNSIIDHLLDVQMIKSYTSYDISPAHPNVMEKDTLKDFPKGFDVCVTNPPWLAKNSATRRGLSYPTTHYDDLYKYALDICLKNVSWLAAIIPETFIRSKDLKERLKTFISITDILFEDTEAPVGLALFEPAETSSIDVWSGSNYLDTLGNLIDLIPTNRNNVNVKFNVPDGNVGLLAVDNTLTNSIRFCSPAELGNYTIRAQCRSKTILQVDGDIDIEYWNQLLNAIRKKSGDVLLSSFKGLRQDGLYRRRLDWNLARRIIQSKKEGLLW